MYIYQSWLWLWLNASYHIRIHDAYSSSHFLHSNYCTWNACRWQDQQHPAAHAIQIQIL